MERGATERAERWEVIDKLSRQYAKPLVAMRAQAFFSPIEQFSWLLNLGVLLSLCDGWVQWVCSDEAGSGPMGANEKRVETNPSPSDRRAPNAPPHRYTRLARSRFLPCPSSPFASIPTNAIQRNNVRSCEKKVMRHPPCFVAKAVMLLKSVRHTYPSFAISLQSLLVSSCKARYAVDAKLTLHSWPQQREERL